MQPFITQICTLLTPEERELMLQMLKSPCSPENTPDEIQINNSPVSGVKRKLEIKEEITTMPDLNFSQNGEWKYYKQG